VPLAQCAEGRYSEAFIRGIDQALSVKPADRPQDIASFRRAMGFSEWQSKTAQHEPSAFSRDASPDASAASSLRSRVMEPSRQIEPTRSSAGTRSAGAPSAEVDAQVQRLLAQHIGPMAKIIYARAQKSAGTNDELVTSVAKTIDDDAARASFVSAANKLFRGKRI
jgi:hypothetical protein